MSSIIRGSTQFVETMLATHPAFTVVFTTSFAVVALFIYAAMMATLMSSYISVRRTIFYYSPTAARDDEMTSFLMKQLKKWLGISKPKPVYCIVLYCIVLKFTYYTNIDIVVISNTQRKAVNVLINMYSLCDYNIVTVT